MRGTVRIEVRDATGQLVATREAGNSVLKAGGELVARLFSGQGAAITHMAVGISDEVTADDFALPGLSNDAGSGYEPLEGATDAALLPENFQLAIDETKHLVRVRVRGTLPPSAAVGTIREGGLLARGEEGDVLYNRVLFDPIEKGSDHELTMFWEVSFPYGDLAWLL